MLCEVYVYTVSGTSSYQFVQTSIIFNMPSVFVNIALHASIIIDTDANTDEVFSHVIYEMNDEEFSYVEIINNNNNCIFFKDGG